MKARVLRQRRAQDTPIRPPISPTECIVLVVGDAKVIEILKKSRAFSSVVACFNLVPADVADVVPLGHVNHKLRDVLRMVANALNRLGNK